MKVSVFLENLSYGLNAVLIHTTVYNPKEINIGFSPKREHNSNSFKDEDLKRELSINLTQIESDIIHDVENKKFSADKRNETLAIVNERLINKFHEYGINTYEDINNFLKKRAEEMLDKFSKNDDFPEFVQIFYNDEHHIVIREDSKFLYAIEFIKKHVNNGGKLLRHNK